MVAASSGPSGIRSEGSSPRALLNSVNTSYPAKQVAEQQGPIHGLDVTYRRSSCGCRMPLYGNHDDLLRMEVGRFSDPAMSIADHSGPAEPVIACRMNMTVHPYGRMPFENLCPEVSRIALG